MELGLDMGGQTDPKRSAVIRNLISHLKWPPGTNVFWPAAGLVDGALQPDPTMFWKGWEQWKPSTIACFGQEALRIIQPDADPSNTVIFHNHVTIYVLPPFARLLTMLPHEQQLAIEPLTSIRM